MSPPANFGSGRAHPDLMVVRHANLLHDIDDARSSAFALFRFRSYWHRQKAMLFSGLSYRGFYLVAARLASRDCVVFEADSRDARVTRLKLSANAKSLLAALQD